MNTLAIELHPQAHTIKRTDADLMVERLDGRTISAPLIGFLRLSQAPQEQLDNWESLGDGEGVHWPDIDEDLSVAGLLTAAH